MKKTIIILMIILTMAVGVVMAVYAADNGSVNRFGCGGPAATAKAMENRDYSAMRSFMNNLTPEQYDRMTGMMRNRGYNGMAGMMNRYYQN